MNSPIFKIAGLVRLATIEKIDADTMTVQISFINNLGNNSLKSYSRELFTAQLPLSYLSSGGGFIGGLPEEGTPVAVAQAEGGEHYFIVSFLARDPAVRSKADIANLNLPKLKRGAITIQAHPNTRIDLNKNIISMGDLVNSITIDTKRKIVINSFSNLYNLSQGNREIIGTILRDKKPQQNFSTYLNKNDTSYNSVLKEIGLDPIADTTNSTYGGTARNPARIEKREIIFEYEGVAQVKSNDVELKGYNNQPTKIPNVINRRENRTDSLSLSLVYPNHLIETIKGTVVDIYGNILDLNRVKIPIGEGENSITKIKTTGNSQDNNKNIYEEIKRLERKSIAYHFELNARKEIQKSGPPNVNIRNDYARNRSRFFFDIDKEGQFKLNVPASSNTGNIPLLVRYENYSTVNPNDKTNDPNDLVFNEEYKDILVEKFLNYDPIKIKDKDGNIVGPVDRFSDPKSPVYIGHGTVYHDISKVARHSSDKQFYKPREYETTTLLDGGFIDPIPPIVSEEIIISGDQANAGGRSGSFVFDGSIEFNVGKNEVDGQSLWVDTEGAIVGSVGQDDNKMSLAASLDGNVFLELGDSDTGTEIGKEGKVFDLKVFDGTGSATVFRIDSSGLSVSTQSRMVFYSSQDMLFRSGAKITMDAEQLVLNGRQIVKDQGSGNIR